MKNLKSMDGIMNNELYDVIFAEAKREDEARFMAKVWKTNHERNLELKRNEKKMEELVCIEEIRAGLYE